MPEIRLPLPIYTSYPLELITARDGEEFSLVIGLDRGLVAQLKEKSLDESDIEIQSHTSDRKRFGEGSYEAWYAKERTPFALVEKKTGMLAALVWFGPKPLGRKSLKYLSEAELEKEGRQEKDAWHTVVYRSYPPFRGKGLMTNFLRRAMDVYLQHYPNVKLWAGMSGVNVASAGLVGKLGFKKDEKLVDTEANWFAMVKDN